MVQHQLEATLQHTKEQWQIEIEQQALLHNEPLVEFFQLKKDSQQAQQQHVKEIM